MALVSRRGRPQQQPGHTRGSHLSHALKGMVFRGVADIPEHAGRTFADRDPHSEEHAEREPSELERQFGSCPLERGKTKGY